VWQKRQQPATNRKVVVFAVQADRLVDAKKPEESRLSSGQNSSD
jgi:hypothetical protein